MTKTAFARTPRIGDNDILVCKTDLQGALTYANDSFAQAYGYGERDLIGQRHNFLRHPEMPRSIFAAIWQRLQAGTETFAVLKNRNSDGVDYWTFAQFSPCRDAAGRVTGYHTVQRGISPAAVAEIAPLYQRLRQAEIAAGDDEPGLQAGNRMLDHHLAGRHQDYDEFVLTLVLQYEPQAA
ncbi:PAS domain-containing protein [Ferrovibrio xuzhouensis]|uniref:PAS domain-containing protein n=1 Tax=Ferrovibrio xuzhouensis TaxID=1576914 RepID=A0ABV7VJN1_9PROT